MGALPQPQTAQQQNELQQLITLVRKDLQIFQKDLIASQNQLKMTKMLTRNQIINASVVTGVKDVGQKLKNIISMFSGNIANGVVDSLVFLAENVLGAGQVSDTTRKYYTTFKEGKGYFRLDVYFTTKKSSGFKLAQSINKSIVGTYYCLSALDDSALVTNEKECIEVMAKPRQKDATLLFRVDEDLVEACLRAQNSSAKIVNEKSQAQINH